MNIHSRALQDALKDVIASEAKQSPTDVIASEAKQSPTDVIASEAKQSPIDVIASEAKQSPTDVIASEAKQSPTDVIASEAKQSAGREQTTSGGLLRRFAPRNDVEGAGGHTEYHVYPGFIESHAHVYGMGERITKPRLEATTSKEEIYDILRTIPGEGWIVSRGWDQNKWEDKHFPTKHDLDQLISPIGPIGHIRPISLTRIDGHAIWCNSKALELAGITKESQAPLGGAIELGEDGEPTGILLDEAMKLIEKLIPQEDEASMKRTLHAGLDYFVKKGHVAVHDMGISREIWQAYKALYAEQGDGLPCAYVFLDMTKPTGKALFLERVEQNIFDDSPHERLKLVGIKLYLDGALGSRGAQLFADYSDDPGNRGLALMGDAEVIHLMQLAAGKKLQIAVHAIGDAANARALDLFEKAGVVGSGATLRVEHAQVVRDVDVSRFAKLGVYPVVQPSFLASDRIWAKERLGARIRTAYRWGSFVKAGAKLVASSDAPIEEPDPIEGIRLMIEDADGEALSLEDAVKAYCTTSRELCPGLPEECYTVLDRQIEERGAKVIKAFAEGATS